MKRFQEQLKKRADTVRLTETEKRDLRARIVSYMEYHPLPEGQRSPIPLRQVGIGALVSGFYMRRAAGAFAVFVMVLIPFVAEQAVPGDVLYPVKVRFNEEVRSTLSLSPYQQVAWETERLERRLAEARVLASEGKLTPEVEAQVANAVREHSDAAQAGIASIRESDSDEAAIAEITFSSALAVQSEMLEGRSMTLATAVDTARQAAEVSGQDNKPSYEKLLARIEQESTNAYELFNTVTDEASPSDRNDIERRLAGIRRAVAAAQQNDSTEEAVASLTSALADTRKVISFMTDLDVRQNVTIDELVPTELTDDERRTLIAERLANVEELSAGIVVRAENVDANTRQAVNARLAEVHSATTTASSSLAAGDIAAADAESERAHTIVVELISTLDQYDAEMGGEAATSTENPTPSSTPATTTAPEGQNGGV